MGLLGTDQSRRRQAEYAEKKIRERDRNAAESAADRDIAAKWPGWGNKRRRAKCRSSLVSFLRTYFPAAFPLPFSPDHLRVIGSLEHIFQHGGLKAIACPRGFGKTSITARAVLWSLLYGHRKFAMLVGATDTLRA